MLTPEETAKQIADELRNCFDNQVVGVVEYSVAFISLMEQLASQVNFMNNSTLEKKIEFMKTVFDKDLPEIHDVSFSLGFEVEDGLYIPVMIAKAELKRSVERVLITAKIASKDANES